MIFIQTNEEKILQRRQQMILHSQAYYKYNFNLVSDAQFDLWARELVTLQQQYSSEYNQVKYASEFADWDGTTGYHLINIEVKYYLSRLYYCLMHLKLNNKLSAEQKEFIDCVDRGIY